MLKGEKAIICGSGHSLTDPQVLKEIKEKQNAGWLIVACKHAVRYLTEQDIKVDYSVTMDPGAHIARPDRKIYRSPGTTHIVASSSDPLLFDYLLSPMKYEDWLRSKTEAEQKRILLFDFDKWKSGELTFPEVPNHPEDHPAKIKLFHSACGVKDEVNLYKKLFKNADTMGGGYNVVNRAYSAMKYMGVSEFIFAGVDCGWRLDTTFYTHGDNPQTGMDMSDQGQIDGKEWRTRPDMMASAVSLVQEQRKPGAAITFLGDCMPRSLMTKEDAFLQKMLSLIQ